MLHSEMTLPSMMGGEGFTYQTPMMDDRVGCPLGCPCPMSMAPVDPCLCQPSCPIFERPIQRCVTRDICHDVQHVCPIDTKIVNNHIFRHTFVPCHTCSEANVACHVFTGSCCDFV